MHGRVVRAAVFLIFSLFSFGTARQSAADDAPSSELTPPVVSFTIDFPGATPSHYAISVAHDAHGTYECNLQTGTLQFTVSGRERDQIFDLAQRTHYFSGKVDSGRKGIANTGNKTLAYKDGQHDSQATYNYSTNPSIEQLTNIFQELSQTLEFGRRLAYSHKYQKTALDEDLKRMEEMQRDNGLGDVQAIAPVLKEIADDQTVMNVSRARALRLMAARTK
jgi:hypothetical protein